MLYPVKNEPIKSYDINIAQRSEEFNTKGKIQPTNLESHKYLLRA